MEADKIQFLLFIQYTLVVLEECVLLQTKPSQKPEAILDLLNAEIKTGAEVEQMSSKKHVISV